ncbi:hypothetical protein SMACR_08056 [Sordaria macrospora]|uniref:WGS project CABT00000000 data, contig 2.50 n=2 Tax=Sordaria macrospora TaxID=5147 RepID=F7W9A9_SORMK|nr:uncharacterized protein SMAC_08056 [Sordaria macrospora k-hell]KAA8631632.1 hypothetical protein SMACR_08056 [Sordaria macrospora]KAH7628831.1 putative TOS1-like glycosyl hydrolase-domain-containing protein [Sordaria sp. MPI-SDFR-AT-0083]WPJ57268.1 hypothetical protein SMAC4_08056 [Sordaria macrospora]CCC05189.1 unnamed protein product [Sordaria macrospora k-hell]
MILNVFKALAVSLVFGTIPGANAFAVGRFGSLSYHGNSTIVARQSDIAPYSTDPEFNPHLDAPDVSADDLCRDHKHQEDIGNWYCQKVDQVIYSKVTKPGTYEADTFMDNESGACSKSPKQFNGDLAPHNEPAKGLPGFARVLLFEFSMPDEPQHNNGGGNKPAVWLLNSRIPNTAQYFDCNCWKSGCGELDVFEVLAPGQDKALSTFHLGDDGKSAGDANYFQRPKGGPITVALVIDATNGGTVSIKNMGASDGARFGASLSAGKVDELKAKSGLVSE